MKKVFVFIAVSLLSGNLIFAQDQLQSFAATEIRLLDGPFKVAEQTDLKYLLSLDADRLLAPYLKEAGLKPKAENYGNWENTGLDGHLGGHYLSALSLMYGATADAQVKQRLDYFINELEKCQNQSVDGYLSGVPDGKAMWAQIKKGDIKANGFSLNGKWVPLYNIHKIYNGLYDAYHVAGSDKAKKILVKLTNWCVALVANLSDAQVQQMLKSEHGGLNEVFANVYTITGDEKYLKLARKFSDVSILNPLLKQQDALNGLHANTQIPKVIGFEQIAKAANDDAWANAANFFWKTVVNHRTVSIGGNSVREHFHPATDFSSMIDSREGPETCNSYNMLKLTKQLFLAKPSANYVDYYERTLYNHILSSQRPGGGFVYFTPMRPGHYRMYSSAQESFWCCVGSGIENHAKYGEMIYSHDNKDVFVNLYVPSTLNWKEKGIKITQQTTFPNSENTTLTVQLTKPKSFAIALRYPSWVLNGKMEIYVNGKKQIAKKDSMGYVRLFRLWKTGDQLSAKLPMHTTTEFMPDQSNWVSFLHGPIVLAAVIDTLTPKRVIADGSRMGHIAEETLSPLDQAPLIVGEKANLANQISADKGKKMQFNASGLIEQKKYKNLKLVPFYTIHDQRYLIYWPYSSQAQLQERIATTKQLEAEKMKLDQLTLDVVNTGEQQPEADHNFKGEQTESGVYLDRHYRNGKAWFSYELKNKQQLARKLRLSLFGKEKNRQFDIFINDVFLTTVTLDGSKSAAFYEVEYEIPVTAAAVLAVKFVAKPNATIANIYEVRLLK
jgi:DUF1680 family protein